MSPTRGPALFSFQNLGNSIIKAVTGTSPDDISAQVTAAEQQIALAVETIIVLELAIAFLLFTQTVIMIKDRK